VKRTFQRLALLAVLATLACRPARPVPTAAQSPSGEDVLVMTTRYEAEIIQQIERFETERRRTSAGFAAFGLTRPDPYAPAEVTTEMRQQSRVRRVVLWGRLFCAIDALRDPEFDPEQDPPAAPVFVDEADIPAIQGPVVTIEALPEPLQQKYRARAETWRRENAWYQEQWQLFTLDREVTELAEEYFKSAFVRSAESVAIVERCAQAGHWLPARRAQVLAWVTPEG
jgi:hypothetical protein